MNNYGIIVRALFFSFSFSQVVQCLVPIKFLIEPYNECEANALKLYGFRALCVKTPLKAY